MVQRTIRFYDQSNADQKALEKLNHYRKYGFDSMRKMMIEAILAYEQREQNLNPEELAALIARNLQGKVTAAEEVLEKPDAEDAYDLALEFIDSL